LLLLLEIIILPDIITDCIYYYATCIYCWVD